MKKKITKQEPGAEARAQVPQYVQKRLWSIAMKDPDRSGKNAKLIERAWLENLCNTYNRDVVNAAVALAQRLGLRVG